VSRTWRHRHRCGRPDRRPGGTRGADLRVPAHRAPEGVAGRDRGCVERGARRLRRERVQIAVSRRRGRDRAVDVLARGSRDPQGAAVRVAAREERLRGARALDRRCGRAAPLRAACRLGGVARQLARARLHDGDGRAVPVPRHCARGCDRAGWLRRWVPAAGAVAGERGLLARVDATPPRYAERLDGVPDHGDGGLGAHACGRRALAQLRRVRRLPARRRGRRPLDEDGALPAPEGGPAVPGRAPAQLQPQVLPALAPALLLLRALERPAARRACLPAGRVAAHAPRPVGQGGRPRRPVRKLVLLSALVVLALPGASTSAAGPGDWGRFGYGASRANVSPDATITAANVSKLKRTQVKVDGTIDSSPIFVSKGVRGHDAFVFTTTYGKTEAVDANSGRVLWRFTPPAYSRLAGTAQITNSTPALSTDRTAVYAAASDGRIRKLRLSDGHVLWTTAITLDPTHEKITSPLNVSRGLVLATTGGYIGDAPPYQGHVVTMSEKTGRIAHVWNSLCSNRRTLIVPRTCGASDSAIWSRNGAAVDPANGDIVVATGNAPFDGKTNWGDSVIVLSPDASRMLRHWTPADQQHLNSSDLDLGSTSPAFLTGGLAVQGGKDGLLRLLNLRTLPG